MRLFHFVDGLLRKTRPVRRPSFALREPLLRLEERATPAVGFAGINLLDQFLAFGTGDSSAITRRWASTPTACTSG